MKNQFKMQEVPFLNAQIIPFRSVSEKHCCELSDFCPPPPCLLFMEAPEILCNWKETELHLTSSS